MGRSVRLLNTFNKTLNISNPYSGKVCVHQNLQYFYPKKLNEPKKTIV